MNEKCKVYMNEALKEAKIAFELNEVPVGAVVVYGDKIISRAHNLKETQNIAINHAEVLAINEACKVLNNWRLSECELYVTCEPCPMCAGAILQSRIKAVYYGCRNEKTGALISSFALFEQNGIEYKPHIYSGILEEESKELLQKFFGEKR